MDRRAPTLRILRPFLGVWSFRASGLQVGRLRELLRTRISQWMSPSRSRGERRLLPDHQDTAAVGLGQGRAGPAGGQAAELLDQHASRVRQEPDLLRSGEDLLARTPESALEVELAVVVP